MEIKNILNEDFDYENDSWDDGEVAQGKSFFEDGYDWKWMRRVGDVVHLDFDNWAVWMAFRPEDENNIHGRNVVAFFIVDEDTGFIDWGPCDTYEEANEFLESKKNDWEMDEPNNNDWVTDESLEEDLDGDLVKGAHSNSSILDNIKTLERSELVDHITPVTMYATEVFEMVATDGRVFYLVPSTLSQFDVYDENEELVTSGEFTRSIPAEVLMDKSTLEFLYELVGGEYAGTYTEEEVKALPCFTGRYTADQSEIRAKGGFTSREELDNKPKLDGYLGPMMGGYRDNKMVLRYETQEVYDRLSEKLHTTKSPIREGLYDETFSQWFDKNCYHPDSNYYPFDNYVKTFESAEVLRDATAEDIRNNAHQFYDIYDVDSADREKAFNFASEKLGMDYDDFYYAWLKEKPISGVNESVLNERGLTRAERHNRNMEKMFAYKKQIDHKMMQFLRDNSDMSEEEIQKAYDDDKLGLVINNLGLKDAFWGTEYKSKAIKEGIDEEQPYTKAEVERDLKSITHNFTDKEGELKCEFEEEKNFGVEILKKHYKVVEVSGDDRREGKWYHISYAEPKYELHPDYLYEYDDFAGDIV